MYNYIYKMLPQNVNYGKSKIESAASSTSYTSCIQPQNGTGPYQLGQTIIFNIPTSPSILLNCPESYLKFKFNLTNGATASAYRFDVNGSHGLIQRIRVFAGSNLISDIDNYNLLTKILFSMQIPDDARQNKYNILAGTRTDYNTYYAGDGGALAADGVVGTYY